MASRRPLAAAGEGALRRRQRRRIPCSLALLQAETPYPSIAPAVVSSQRRANKLGTAEKPGSGSKSSPASISAAEAPRPASSF